MRSFFFFLSFFFSFFFRSWLHINSPAQAEVDAPRILTGSGYFGKTCAECTLQLFLREKIQMPCTRRAYPALASFFHTNSLSEASTCYGVVLQYNTVQYRVHSRQTHTNLEASTTSYDKLKVLSRLYISASVFSAVLLLCGGKTYKVGVIALPFSNFKRIGLS